MVIFVGFAQESGTERNPLNISTRLEMLKEVYEYSPNIMIYALSDMSNENDIRPEWGKYLLENIDRYVYKAPEVMIYGNDEARSHWFDMEDIKGTTELIVNRGYTDISATKLRKLMVLDDRKEWMKWVSPKLHKHYDRLRNELMTVPFYIDLRETLTANS